GRARDLRQGPCREGPRPGDGRRLHGRTRGPPAAPERGGADRMTENRMTESGPRTATTVDAPGAAGAVPGLRPGEGAMGEGLPPAGGGRRGGQPPGGNTADQERPPPETYAAPQAPSRGSAPARGQWGRDSPMRGGVTGGVIPPGEKLVIPPEEIQLN